MVFIDINKYMEKFKVIQSPTLFDTDDFIELIKKGLCPLCTNKLHLLRYRPTYMCTGKRHAKPFLISKEKFDKIKGVIPISSLQK